MTYGAIALMPGPFATLLFRITFALAGCYNRAFGLWAGFHDTLGGLVLMLNTPALPKWVRAAMWGTWLAGFSMTMAALVNHVGGMVVTTSVLFPLLITWTVWMGARWGRL